LKFEICLKLGAWAFSFILFCSRGARKFCNPIILNACYWVIATESAINAESFRESLSTERYQAFESPALRESEARDRKRTADNMCSTRRRWDLNHPEHDVVAAKASGVIDQENGTVAARHGIPLQKLSVNGSSCFSLANEKCLPDRQWGADCDHKITVGDNKCIIAPCRLI
jgi:hypothetical protein